MSKRVIFVSTLSCLAILPCASGAFAQADTALKSGSFANGKSLSPQDLDVLRQQFDKASDCLAHPDHPGCNQVLDHIQKSGIADDLIKKPLL
jgi:hypothetical protein